MLLALGAGMLHPEMSHAASITVDNGVVVVANDNKCSLVEAILNANSNNQVFTAAGECAAGSGADIINLPGGGAFNLLTAYGGNAFYSDNGLPSITSDITFEGNGAKIERDGTALKFRILAVSSTGNLKLNNTTISGGDTGAWGGGIYVTFNGQATLTGSTIFGNGAYNGGGIATKLGTVSLTHSTVSGNSAGQFGGGLHSNLGTVTLTNSTVSGNEAGNRGGGISVLHGNVMTVTHSTIQGNTAANGGGAIYHLGGTVALTNTTISDNTTTADNGGGILNRGGSTTITNSTITANSAAQGGGGGLHEEHQLAQVYPRPQPGLRQFFPRGERNPSRRRFRANHGQRPQRLRPRRADRRRRLRKLHPWRDRLQRHQQRRERAAGRHHRLPGQQRRADLYPRPGIGQPGDRLCFLGRLPDHHRPARLRPQRRRGRAILE